MQIRTNLRLKTESEEQEQVLQEFKLKREKERTKLSELYSGTSLIWTPFGTEKSVLIISGVVNHTKMTFGQEKAGV